jgi:exodeoxyribonuclease VII large subunit
LAVGRALEHRREGLAVAVQGLDARSPLATLARGYALVTRAVDGAILRDAAGVAPGERIQARLARGALVCRVEDAAQVGAVEPQR